MAGVRNAETTKEAILTAATAEFSRHGFAGARVERIAATSGKNRAMIYAYFESKELLFKSVFDRVVASVTSRVPIDADDLAGYAVSLFDEAQQDPHPTRLAAWDRLERDATGLQADLVRTTNAAKVDAIAAAQRAGSVSDRIPADHLLDVVIALSRLQGRDPAAETSEAAVAARRRTVHEAVSAVVSP